MTRAEAIKWITSLRENLGNTEYRGLWHYEEPLTDIIEFLQTEQKTTKWIIEIEEEHTEKYDARIPHWFCSCCRTEYDPYSATRVNYCSNYGAKMEI